MTQFRYTAELANEIEAHWQERWEEEGAFYAANPVGDLAGDTSAPKFFIQDMFPYPSGRGLHVGHPLGYIATDTVARYHRMKGENVLYTMGYDAFGLPAEQFAVQNGKHPAITTAENIANMAAQLHRLGPGPLRNSKRNSPVGKRPRRMVGPGRRSPGKKKRMRSASTAWFISRKPRLIGVRGWERCLPMRKSPRKAGPNAVTSRCSGAISPSG